MNRATIFPEVLLSLKFSFKEQFYKLYTYRTCYFE